MDDKEIERDEDKSNIEDGSSSDDSLDLDLELKCEICIKTFSSVKSLLQHEKSGKHHKKLSQKKLLKKVNKDLDDELSSEFGDFTLYPKSFAECDACKKKFSGPESFHQHLKSKVHQKNVARAKLLEQVTEDGKIDVQKFKEICRQKKTPLDAVSAVGASGYSPTFEEVESDDIAIAESHQFECADCEKVFTGVDPWYQHLVSKNHEKILKQKKLLDQVTSGVLSGNPAESTVASSSVVDLDAIEVDGDVLICQLCHMSFSGPESAAAHLKSKGHAKKKALKEWKIEHSTKSARVVSQKTKAKDSKNESQTSVPASAAGFEENKPMDSSEIVNNLSTERSPSDRSQKDDSQFSEESGGDMKNPDSSASYDNDAAETEQSETEVSESVPNDEKENALLCYKSYKNYKKIMNKIEAENNLLKND